MEETTKKLNKEKPKKTKRAKKQPKFAGIADGLIDDIKNLKKNGLTIKQKEFCRLYASDREFFANGVQSYIEAYKIDISEKGAYESAKQCAYRLLTNVDICQEINRLFEDRGLNDNFVDKQLEFLITQQADPRAKIAAIREYNQIQGRIKKRITTETPDGSLTHGYENLTDEEIENEIRKRKTN
jgi:hypothetical protein